ncbi:hypothetical protein ES288_D04G112500v1 [Gossypium darwinii]|uniref:Uncharacterized protein n=1 Tax=Gossypium darwinii TaxID=34276 RepID=A0A5D2CVD2_GOSDA|nr:hypothetical protein ES288_D04G112500v1 [Gossypium darwinii]
MAPFIRACPTSSTMAAPVVSGTSPNVPSALKSTSRLQVGNRTIRKRIHVRAEHVQPSRCVEEFKLRKVKNDQLKAEAKAKGEVISTKRQPKGPKPGFMVEGATLETVTPIPYDVVNDLKGGY